MKAKTLKYLNSIEEIMGCSILVIMVIVLAIQVFSRKFLGTSFMWSEELARYCMIWMTFMGIGYGVKKHIHLEMTFVYEKFPPILKKSSQIFTNITVILFYSYSFSYCIDYVIYQHKIMSTGMKIPMSYIYSIVPIGIVIMVIRLIVDTIEIIRNKDFGKVKEVRL